MYKVRHSVVYGIFGKDFRRQKTLQSRLGDAKRPEESIGESFSTISRRNQKLQHSEVDARLLQMGEFQS
jgi:hypothetical protein